MPRTKKDDETPGQDAVERVTTVQTREKVPQEKPADDELTPEAEIQKFDDNHRVKVYFCPEQGKRQFKFECNPQTFTEGYLQGRCPDGGTFHVVVTERASGKLKHAAYFGIAPMDAPALYEPAEEDEPQEKGSMLDLLLAREQSNREESAKTFALMREQMIAFQGQFLTLIEKFASPRGSQEDALEKLEKLSTILANVRSKNDTSEIAGLIDMVDSIRERVGQSGEKPWWAEVAKHLGPILQTKIIPWLQQNLQMPPTAGAVAPGPEYVQIPAPALAPAPPDQVLTMPKPNGADPAKKFFESHLTTLRGLLQFQTPFFVADMILALFDTYAGQAGNEAFIQQITDFLFATNTAESLMRTYNLPSTFKAVYDLVSDELRAATVEQNTVTAGPIGDSADTQ